nr:TPA: NADH dehydrogenase subunit 3 [Cylicobdellidae sp. FA-2019]
MHLMTYIFILCFMLPSFIYILSYTLFMRNYLSRNKISPFECGFDTNSQARLPFSTRFFMLAIIFIIFDIEVVMLAPIPLLMFMLSYKSFMLSFSMFMLILMFGLIHEWNEGSLNWMD